MATLTRYQSWPPPTVDLTRTEKIQLGVALAAVVTIAGVAIYLRHGSLIPTTTSSKPPNYGIRINKSCSDYEVTDQARFEATFGVEVNDALASGELDPHAIVKRFLIKVSQGRCKGYPGDTRSPNEALLYYTLLGDVLDEMLARRMISDQVYEANLLTTEGWAIGQGVAREDLDEYDDLLEIEQAG